MKNTVMAFLCLGFLVTACSAEPDNSPAQNQLALEQQKTLPQNLNVTSGLYTASIACGAQAQTDKLKNLHWTFNIKDDGHYISSEQNLDGTCTENCSEVVLGTAKFSEVQTVFTPTKKLNLENQVYESKNIPASKTYFVMSYDRTKGTLVLVDTAITNICGSKMVLTLQK